MNKKKTRNSFINFSPNSYFFHFFTSFILLLKLPCQVKFVTRSISSLLVKIRERALKVWLKIIVDLNRLFFISYFFSFIFFDNDSKFLWLVYHPCTHFFLIDMIIFLGLLSAGIIISSFTYHEKMRDNHW